MNDAGIGKIEGHICKPKLQVRPTLIISYIQRRSDVIGGALDDSRSVDSDSTDNFMNPLCDFGL